MRIEDSFRNACARAYGGTEHEITVSITQTSDGNYAFAGFTDSFGAGGRDFYLATVGVESGLAWADSTADTITLYRGATDPYWNYVRAFQLKRFTWSQEWRIL